MWIRWRPSSDDPFGYRAVAFPPPHVQVNDYYAVKFASEIGFFLDEHGYPIDEFMTQEIFFDEDRFVIRGFLPGEFRDATTAALFGRPASSSRTALYKSNWLVTPRHSK